MKSDVMRRPSGTVLWLGSAMAALVTGAVALVALRKPRVDRRNVPPEQRATSPEPAHTATAVAPRVR